MSHHRQEREDTFKKRHLDRKECSRRFESVDNFRHRLEDPKPCEELQERVRSKRNEHIRAHLTRLERLERQRLITDTVVAEVMASWDVVPDAVCAVLQRAGYHCFSEAVIKMRDDAIAAATAKQA